MTENDILKKIGELTLSLQERELDTELLIERVKLYLKIERRDLALNDLNTIVAIDSEHVEANSYILMVTAIDDYFYNQIYNV